MQRKFLKQFIDKILNSPSWIKGIIYSKLSEEMDESNEIAYEFATYKPVLTYKGKCELDYKQSNFDNNIYSILEHCDNDFTVSEIALNNYMSMEEIASYILFCIDEGYLQLPDNSKVFNIAGFLAGKFKTGEYFVQNGVISEGQLNDAVEQFNNNKPKIKFGQSLVNLGLISQKQLDFLISVKEEAKKRFVLDHNEIPKIKEEYANSIDEYEKQIELLKKENQMLKSKLNQLLAMMKK